MAGYTTCIGISNPLEHAVSQDRDRLWFIGVHCNYHKNSLSQSACETLLSECIDSFSGNATRLRSIDSYFLAETSDLILQPRQAALKNLPLVSPWGLPCAAL